MNNAIEKFESFFEKFRQTDIWRAMVNTREDSPWHREANVGEHTKMLINHYMNTFAKYRSPQQNMISLVACLMHDIGKPPSEVVKTSEERGTYRSYGGHEQVSARMWIDYAFSHQEEIEALNFNICDVSNIAMMLEYHVPYSIKDKNKRKAIKVSLVSRMGEHGHQAWLDFITCDQHGRNSDNQAEKLENFYAWMEEWKTV